MLNLVGEEEMLEEGRCCKSLGPIDNGSSLTVNEEGPLQLTCFEIYSGYDLWTICSKNKDELDSFRDDVKKVTIR